MGIPAHENYSPPSCIFAAAYRYGNSLPSGKPCTAAARKSSPIPAVRGGIDTEDRRESNAEGSDSDADDNSEDISVDDSDNDLVCSPFCYNAL